MRRQLGPFDALLVVCAIALLALVFGLQASVRTAAVAPGPLTVSEAVAFLSDEPLVLRGWLVRDGAQTLLCERPRCAGPRLSVLGLGAGAPHGAVLIVGTVRGDRIRALPAPTRVRATRL